MTTRQDSSTTGSGLIYMSQGKYLYSAMQTMSQYELELMQQWLQQMQNYAEAYGGWTGTKGPNGEENFALALKSDGSAQGGLIGNFLDETNQAASLSGDVYRDDANIAIASASVGSLGLMGQLGSYFSTRDSGLDTQMKDAELMQKDLKEAPNANAEMQEEKPYGPLTQEDSAIEAKIESWSNDKSSLRYTQKYGKVSAEEEALNKKAIQHAAASGRRAKIDENLNKHIESLQNRSSQNSMKFNSRSNVINQVSGVGTNIGQSIGNYQKANDQQYSQEVASKADVLKQLQPQETGFISNAQQKADQFAQDANSIAAAYGQIVSTHA